MSANDLVLWALVAVVAFLVGQSRTGSTGLTVGREGAGEPDDAERTLVSYRRWVLAFIERSYSLAELQGVAFEIGVVWDRLGGNTISERGRELIIYCERNGMIAQMLDAFRIYRR